MNFDKIFDRVVGTEGGFTSNSKDPGNWTGGKVNKGELKGTKFGIAANTYPDIDIVSLTANDAKAIYLKDFWLQNRIERFSNAMQYQMFDAAFNHGMRNASRIFQRSVGANDDGVIGPKTMQLASMFSENDKLLRFLACRIRFYTNLKTFDTFGRGWSNRIANNLIFAAKDN